MTDTVLFLGLALAYVVLLAWGIAVVRGRRAGVPGALPLLVVAGLVYDNAVLGLGRFVGEGPTLETLNVARYGIHAVATPLLVVTARWCLARAGVGWARTPAAAVGAVALAAGLVVLEVVTVLSDLRLAPRTEHGVLAYADVAETGPPVMVIVVGLALVVAGFGVWRGDGWAWLLVGSALMLVGSAVPVPVDSGAVTNLFELVLLVSVVATVRHLAEPRSPEPSAAQDTLPWSSRRQ